MIQVYAAGNGNYEMNGDAILTPIECTVKAEINGSWELSIVCPIDEAGNFKYITEGAVIAAPTFVGSKQLFRLYEVNRTLTEVSGTGRPVFYDSMDDVILLDNRPVDKNGQQALNWIMSGTAYTGSSNITTVRSATYIRKNLIEALLGDDDNSFVNRWGGEASFNNYQIILNERLGSDRGVIVAYRKNITAINENVSLDDTITRIIPVAYNGRMLSGENPWVDSPKILQYPKVMARVIKFDRYIYRGDIQGPEKEGDRVFDTIAELQSALVAACEQMYEDGADDPQLTINIDMVDLSVTDEYKNYRHLEAVTLGDTVHCYHSILGIETAARVQQIEWNCCLNCVSKVTLGTTPPVYFDNVTKMISQVTNVLDSSGRLVAERVRGALDLLQVQLRLQQDVAEHSDVRAILFEDLDENSPTYGALCIGTQGIQIAHTREDDQWDWGTAIDSKTIYASQMISGLLSDKTGTNYWNLDTGEFRLGSTTYIDTAGDVQTLDEYVENLSSQVDAFTVYLTNDFTGVAPAQDGTVTNCSTQASAYYGSQNVTAVCVWSVEASSGITGSWDVNTKTYTVSKLIAESGRVKITAVYNGVVTVSKTFTVSRVMEGEAGQSFQIEASDEVIRIKDQFGRPNVDTVTFNSYIFIGTSLEREPFAGRWRIETTSDGGSYTTVYESDSDEDECEYQTTAMLVDSDNYALVDDDGYGLYSGDISDVAVKVTLFAPGAFTLPIATKKIVFVREAEALTPEQCFNILTNNGEAHGIIRSGNQLYIAMDYLSSGTVRTGLLKSADGSNYWNLDTGEMKLTSATKVDDGTLGTMQNNITINAEGLMAEIVRAEAAEGTLQSNITATASDITAEVSRAQGAEAGLSSRININAEGIQARITSAQAQTLIDASADSIRMKTGTLTWEAVNSSLSANGILRTTSDAGTSEERSTRMSGGQITFYKGNSVMGRIAPMLITGRTSSGSQYTYEGTRLVCGTNSKCLAIGVNGVSPVLLINNGMSQYSEDVIIEGTAAITQANIGIGNFSAMKLVDIDIWQRDFSGTSRKFVRIENGGLWVDSSERDIPGPKDLTQYKFMSGGHAMIQGDLYVVGTISQGSDERLKTIEDWPDLDEALMELEPIAFRWKDGDGDLHFGLGAQTTRKVLQDHDIEGFVEYNPENDTYGVRYQELAPMLLRTIQKDRRRIEELEDRVAALEDMVRKLTERMD